MLTLNNLRSNAMRGMPSLKKGKEIQISTMKGKITAMFFKKNNNGTLLIQINGRRTKKYPIY
jgi:hypothetical protein